MRILFIAVCIFGATSYGYEIGPAGVFSSYNSTSFTTTGNPALSVSPSAASGYGGGLVGIFPLNTALDLQVRAFYISEASKGTFTGTATGIPVTGTISSTAPFIQVPVFLSLHLWKLGLHAGGYYAIATGNVNSTLTMTALGVTTSINSNSTNNTNDYGVAGGLDFKTDLSNSVALFISADYFYGLANMNASSTGYGSSTSQIIEGVLGILFKL